MTISTNLIPTDRKPLRIFFYDILGGLQRPMWRCECGVKEERLLFSCAGEFVDVLDRVISDCIGVIKILAGMDPLISIRKSCRIVVTAGAGDCSEKPIETSLHGPVMLRFNQLRSEMPLAGHRGTVASGAECFCNRHAILAQVAFVSRIGGF